MPYPIYRVLLRLPPVVPFLPPSTVRTQAAQLTGKGGPPKGGNKYFPFSLSPSFRFQSPRPALFLYHLSKSVFRPIPPSPFFVCLRRRKRTQGRRRGKRGVPELTKYPPNRTEGECFQAVYWTVYSPYKGRKLQDKIHPYNY